MAEGGGTSEVDAAMEALSVTSFNTSGPEGDEVAKLVELREAVAEDVNALAGMWRPLILYFLSPQYSASLCRHTCSTPRPSLVPTASHPLPHA